MRLETCETLAAEARSLLDNWMPAMSNGVHFTRPIPLLAQHPGEELLGNDRRQLGVISANNRSDVQQ